MEQSSTDANMQPNDDSGFSLTRRSMLGALGACATVGLAGCSGVTEQSFTAPWIGFNGETFAHGQSGPQPVTLKKSEAPSKSETRDAGALGELKATMNMKSTSYTWQLEDEYPTTVGFMSIPIPKLGSTEFAGPIDDPLNSLVAGEWGLELFNRMGFTDDPVDSVEYGRLNRDEFSNAISHPELQSSYDIKVFSATGTIDGESTEEYRIGLMRYRTKAEALPDSTNDSYVFHVYGALFEDIDRFGYRPYWSLDNADQYGLIDQPSA